MAFTRDDLVEEVLLNMGGYLGDQELIGSIAAGLSNSATTFTVAGSVFGDSSVSGFQPGVIWKDYLNLEWRLGKSLIWRTIEAQFYVPVNVNDRDPEQLIGTGFTWSFK